MILKENYESVIAMQELKEALERVDSSYQFMLVAKGIEDVKEKQSLEAKATKAFEVNCQLYDSALSKEEKNALSYPTHAKLPERIFNSHGIQKRIISQASGSTYAQMMY